MTLQIQLLELLLLEFQILTIETKIVFMKVCEQRNF